MGAFAHHELHSRGETMKYKITKKSAFLSALIFATAHFSLSAVAQDLYQLTVHKTSSCGCCKKWVSHIEEAGIETKIINHEHLTSVKAQYSIEPRSQSCHTAVDQHGVVFEGHIPAKFIRQFQANPLPNVVGLSVPAMPLGSPGMEFNDRFQPYEILLLMNDGSSKVYKKVSTYEEQFN